MPWFQTSLQRNTVKSSSLWHVTLVIQTSWYVSLFTRMWEHVFTSHILGTRKHTVHFMHTLSCAFLNFFLSLYNKNGGFPGGAVVENLPANAGNTGSSPGLGGSRMPRSGWAREPWLLSLRVWSLCSATREAATVRGPRTAMKSGPHLPRLERALAQKRRPNTAKNK